MLQKLGLTLLRIELPFRLNHVNCFLAEGEHGWTMIDTGLNNTYTRERWSEVLRGKEVSDIFITHYHPDHFGYAGGLQAETGAKLSMTEVDEAAGLMAWSDEFLTLIGENYRKAGIPSEAADAMVENTSEFKRLVSPLPTVDHYFKHGEKVYIGSFEYEVLYSPGHSDGMVSFYNKENSIILSADHILPRISPNISYWFHGDENPLGSYIASLRNMKKLDIDYVVPSHGKPFHGANKRIDELIAHHEERLEVTLDALTAPITVYDVCSLLFHPNLTVHEMRFAIGETIAHLEYLRSEGLCERELMDGQWLYTKK